MMLSTHTIVLEVYMISVSEFGLLAIGHSCFKPLPNHGPAGVLDDPGSWNDGFSSAQDMTSSAVPEASSRERAFEIEFVD